jgi:hypothetical protein
MTPHLAPRIAVAIYWVIALIGNGRGNPSRIEGDTMDALAIYVPTTTGRSFFAKGSAIVGRGVQNGGYITCHVQEDKVNDGETKFYAWRPMHAADRLMAGAPTYRIRNCEAEEIVRVGTYDGRRLVVLAIDDRGAFEDWTGESADEVIGRRLPPGPVPADELRRLSAEPRVWQIREDWVRTQAGQVLTYDAATKHTTIWEHDDPEVTLRLHESRLAETVISRVTGR